MEQGVGSILHEARTRRQIDLVEVEAVTRIRQRYLRAIENEEWDVLPGTVYARGFVRTYASFLGLDGERLAADFSRTVEGSVRGGPEPVQPAASGPPMRGGRGWRPTPGVAGVIVATAVIALAVLVVAVSGGGSGQESGAGSSSGGGSLRSGDRAAPRRDTQASRPGVSVRLVADGEVWVCLLDARGGALVKGQILEAGAEEGPFHSDSFTVSFGNGEVSMLIDGRKAKIPATSSPIGYSIDSSGTMAELSETERPTC